MGVAQAATASAAPRARGLAGLVPQSCHSCTTPLTVKKEPASGKTLPHGAQKTSANYVILIASNRETPARKPNSPTHINAEGD